MSAPPAIRRLLEVDRVEDAGGGVVRLVMAPTDVPVPEPAQFYMVLGRWSLDPLLPRPFSVARWTVSERGVSLELLLKVVGRGTALLAALRPGDELWFTGPLGGGFPLVAPGSTAWLVAGGIGVAPFPALAERLAAGDVQTHLLLGAQSAGEVPGTSDFAGLLAGPVRVATDDGSQGHRGHVVSLLELALTEADRLPDVVYSCGPDIMLRATAGVCASSGVRNLASLEAPMACGVGTCRGCVIRAADGSNFTVCTDGPVVDATRIWPDRVVLSTTRSRRTSTRRS